MYLIKVNETYDKMIRMTPSPTICTTAISVRLTSSKLKVSEIFPSFPAISPTVILPPAGYFHRIEVGGRNGSPTSLSEQQARQPGQRSESAPLSATPGAAPRRGMQPRGADRLTRECDAGCRKPQPTPE